MKLLGREQGEAFIERKAHLMAEHRQGTGAGAVVLFRTAAKNEFHQVEILAHRSSILSTTRKGGEVYSRRQLPARFYQRPKCAVYGRSRPKPDSIAVPYGGLPWASITFSSLAFFFHWLPLVGAA